MLILTPFSQLLRTWRSHRRKNLTDTKLKSTIAYHCSSLKRKFLFSNKFKQVTSSSVIGFDDRVRITWLPPSIIFLLVHSNLVWFWYSDNISGYYKFQSGDEWLGLVHKLALSKMKNMEEVVRTMEWKNSGWEEMKGITWRQEYKLMVLLSSAQGVALL